MKLPTSVSCLLLSHQGEVFFFFFFLLSRRLKSSGLYAVILTRDSSYERGIKARSEDFPSLHTYCISGCATTSLLCNSKDASSRHVFLRNAKCLFFFLWHDTRACYSQESDGRHFNVIRIDSSKYKAYSSQCGIYGSQNLLYTCWKMCNYKKI